MKRIVNNILGTPKLKRDVRSRNRARILKKEEFVSFNSIKRNEKNKLFNSVRVLNDILKPSVKIDIVDFQENASGGYNFILEFENKYYTN